MTNRQRRWGLAAFLALCVASPVKADPIIGGPTDTDPFISNTNLMGGGTLRIYDQTSGSYGAVMSNPGTPFNGGYAFALPAFVTTGDVGIDDMNGNLVGLIRFADTSTTGYEEVFGPGMIPANAAPGGYITVNSNGVASLVAGDGAPATTNFYNVVGFAAVPEPSSLALMGIAGLAGAGYSLSRRRRASRA